MRTRVLSADWYRQRHWVLFRNGQTAYLTANRDNVRLPWVWEARDCDWNLIGTYSRKREAATGYLPDGRSIKRITISKKEYTVEAHSEEQLRVYKAKKGKA